MTLEMASNSAHDVVILGGGLAGNCLARQLVREQPGIRVLVVEKRAHPVREAAFKVGESTVEIAGSYFGDVLGLRGYMADHQLPKFGLRYFFPQDGNRDLTRRFEVGPVRFPDFGTFQIDRGRFENHLVETNRALGVDVRDAATVRGFEFGNPSHTVTFEQGGQTETVTTRWIVDASGRGSLIKRQLGMRRPVGHLANAAWFRVRGRLKVDDWSGDAAWCARESSRSRWLSTVHLMGRGYWVWLIPLASDTTSVGIVADADLHPFSTTSRMEKAQEWLDRFEPQCGEVVRAHRGDVEDFLALQHFAHGCDRVFSAERWCLVGEAGVFTDPFYSPGSDFIGLGNDMTTALIGRDLDGLDIRRHAAIFNETYLRVFEAYLKVYEQQYPIMGNARVMTAKIAWDNACYWGMTALIFVHRRFREVMFLGSVEKLLRRFFVLHVQMQRFFREWDRRDATPPDLRDGFINLIDVDFLGRLQAALAFPLESDDALRAKLDENLALLERFASTLQAMAIGPVPASAAEFTIPNEADLVERQLSLRGE
jgi:flavin-dependent dehydrogenase